MRKIAIAILALALLLPLASCCKDDPPEPTTTAAPATTTEPATAQASPGEAELRALLEKEIEKQILDFKYGDYDSNGTYEAFAFVGEAQDPEEDEGYTGEIWFVSATGARMLEEGGYFGLIEVVTFGGSSFAVMDQYATTGGFVSVWGVRGGKPRRESISNAGGGMKQIDGKDFTLWHSTYDAMFDTELGFGLGHTWKNYWFYWDGESFHEYGGVKITEAQLRKCEGAAAVLDGIKKDGETIGEIFYRGNGIINVNHAAENGQDRRNSFTLLQLDGTKVTVVEAEDNSGFYLPALAPDIAVYPELPQIFN